MGWIRDIRLRAAALLLFICGFAGAVQAQHALVVDAVVGFGGVFRPGSWTPIHVTAQNLGQEIRGEIELAVTTGDRLGENRNEIRIRRPIELVSGASKSFSFVMPLDTTVYPLRVSITDGEETAHEEQYDLRGRGVPGTLVVVLSRRPNLDFLLPLFNTQEERNLDIVYPLPGYLPESWHGYAAVDTVILHDARVQDLTASQIGALRDWIGSGGRLVISGGAHFGPADATVLAPIVDITAQGARTVTLGEAGFLEAGLPLAPDERGATVVATPFVEAGVSIDRRDVGSGDVVLLPVDYANLAAVAPLTSVGLWNALVSRRISDSSIPTATRRRVFETDILSNQLSLPVYPFPSRLLVLGLVASYAIGLAALLIWIYRGAERRRTIPGLAAVLGLLALVGATGHFALTRTLQPVEALELSIERADVATDGGYAIVTRDTALFSRHAKRYDVSFNGNPVLIPLDGADHTVSTDPAESAQILELDRWGYANSVAVSVVPFDVTIRLNGGDEFQEIEVRNGSDRTITNLVALWNGVPTELGSLFPGDVAEALVDRSPETDFGAIDWNAYVAPGDLIENRSRLLGDIARRQRFEGDTREVLVVGWTDRALLPATVSPSFTRSIDLHIMSARVLLPEGDQ